MKLAVVQPPRAEDLARHVQISEIYTSLQGESAWAGRPTVFVRTTGCPVRCTYCDTAYAFAGGARRRVGDVLAEVAASGQRRVCITGGEPLAQQGTFALAAALVAAGYDVSVETSGVRPLAGLARPCKVVLDLKTPGSGVAAAWLPATLRELQAGDELKVVLTSRADWDWLLAWLDAHEQEIPHGVEVGVSPVWGQVSPAELSAWILASGRDLKLNLQLHKVIWPDDERGR